MVKIIINKFNAGRGGLVQEHRRNSSNRIKRQNQLQQSPASIQTNRHVQAVQITLELFFFK